MELAKQAQSLEIVGRYRELRSMAETMVKARPDWALGHYFLGSARCGMGMLDEAERSIRKAIAHDDRRAGYFVRLGEVLNRLGNREDALACAERAIELDGENPKVLVPGAMIRSLAGDTPDAYRLLDGALDRGISSPKLRMVHAQLGAEVGHIGGGIEALRRLLSEHDDGRGLEQTAHSECRLALAKLLDRAGEYDDAFEQARLGGALRATGYGPDEVARVCDDRLAAWSADRFDGVAHGRIMSEEPVFIVGMPRSGTSLVEQIIASHPRAYGCGELLDAWRAAHELCEPDEYIGDRSAKVDQLKPAALDRAARGVLKPMQKAAAREKGKGVARITDKLPNNYEFVGIIHKMLPNARFIHCVRNPLDTCVSCFLLDFVGDRNHGYSYDLGHLAHQYRVYQQYMAHWRSIASIPMLEVRYEQLIEHPEAGAREIIGFLGLEWDDACAKPHETVRAVSTLSSDQVRKPVYTSARERWRNYEAHIGVLIEALGTGTAGGGG